MSMGELYILLLLYTVLCINVEVVCSFQPDEIGSLESLEELRLDCNDLLHLPPVSRATLIVKLLIDN